MVVAGFHTGDRESASAEASVRKPTPTQLQRDTAQFRSLSFQYFVPCSVAWRARQFFVIW